MNHTNTCRLLIHFYMSTDGAFLVRLGETVTMV